MNPFIAQITGAALREDVPVPCAVLPAKSYRDRLAHLRKRRGEQRTGDEFDDITVREALGEAQKPADVIPDDAQELDPQEQSGGTITSKLRPIKDVVQEPTKPKEEDEKFTSPFSALTAPDATPEAMTQVDPSKLPGVATDKFSTKDATEAAGPDIEAPAAQQTPPGELPAPDRGMDSAMHTMDVLLGRKRVGQPASERRPEEFQQAGQITTEAHALAVLNITPEGSAVSGESLLGRGQEMPPPAQGDGKPIYEAFRRFGG